MLQRDGRAHSARGSVARLAMGCVVAVTCSALAAGDPAPRDVVVADGIVVTLRPAVSRFDDANTTWIETQMGVVLIDAPSDRSTIESVMRGSLRDVVRQVDEARAAGLTLEAAQQAIDLSAWRERLARDDAARRVFDGTMADAIEAAWREVEGK